MSAHNLAMDSFWVDKGRYDEAERLYYERLAKAGSVTTLTPLADEVAKARQRLIEIRGNVEDVKSVAKETEAPPIAPQPAKPAHPEPAVKEQAPVQAEVAGSCTMSSSVDCGAIKFLEKKVVEFQDVLQKIQNQLSSFDARLISLEGRLAGGGAAQPAAAPVCTKPAAKPEDDDDVDLFGSESEDDESAAKIKEERLAAYNAKKSKKPALIAKSSILLDIKPWDDETDMKAMEKCVRVIATDGLLWGASKLVPLAYGIHKLQINCVVEDEKVSIDWLQEEIEKNEDYVQSVDIAAFNKI